MHEINSPGNVTLLEIYLLFGAADSNADGNVPHERIFLGTAPPPPPPPLQRGGGGEWWWGYSHASAICC